MFSLPQPISGTLTQLTSAIAARSRALNHKFYSVEVTDEFDDDFSPPMEKLQVTFQKKRSAMSPIIRIIYWSDRWVWVDARAGSKDGWLWSFTRQGRLVGGQSGRNLLEHIEQFHELFPVNGDKLSQDDAATMWESILLDGPRSRLR
jgi:hypothetical protein